MPAIQTITDVMLISAVKAASRRVVVITPGVWPPLATAIAEAWSRLGRDRVTVILDINPEVCRMGYGSIEGLEILQKAAAEVGEAVGNEAGVRISILIADEQTFIFSPTPRLLEAPPDGSAQTYTTQPKANGIVLSKPPENVEDDLGAGVDGVSARSVGLEFVKPEQMEVVKRELTANPPKSFDLARAVNVYNAKIRFVELRISGYRVSEQKVTLPKHLVNIARKNEALSKKIESAIKLLDEGDPLIAKPTQPQTKLGQANETISQTTVESARDAVEKKHLCHIKGIGKVIQRKNIAAFEAEIVTIETMLASFSELLNARLAEHYRTTADAIADAILPDVMKEIPVAWRAKLGSNPRQDHVRFCIIDDLFRSFGDPDARCKNLKASYIYKDVTYDMLSDSEFIRTVHKRFPELPLMEEFSAAKERSNFPQDELFP